MSMHAWWRAFRSAPQASFTRLRQLTPSGIWHGVGLGALAVAAAGAGLCFHELTLVIEQLDALLADSDGAAVGFWEAHAGRFNAVCPTHARAVSAALADFDFDLARDALRACGDALGSPSS